MWALYRSVEDRLILDFDSNKKEGHESFTCPLIFYSRKDAIRYRGKYMLPCEQKIYKCFRVKVEINDKRVTPNTIIIS